MQHEDIEPDPGPLWVRAAPVARQLGFTLKMFEAGIASGSLPLATMALGKRELLYVSSVDLARYMASVSGRRSPAAFTY